MLTLRDRGSCPATVAQLCVAVVMSPKEVAGVSDEGTVSKDMPVALLQLIGLATGVITLALSLISWKDRKSGVERLLLAEAGDRRRVLKTLAAGALLLG